MKKRFKLAVLIGRFEPFHNGHMRNVEHAFEIADEVVILVGSSHQPRTPKNPFLYNERHDVISDAINLRIKGAKFTIHPLADYKYNNNAWICEVQNWVGSHKGVADTEICILGHDKDDSSWYNHAFPAWTFISLDGFVEFGLKPIDATKIRELFFEGHMDYIQSAVPPSVFSMLNKFSTTAEYNSLVEEYKFYKEYHKSWEPAPFVPIFQTTDAVVVQGGHILLIQRGFSPGKGLWALPGGFINPKELIEDCVIRELIEETKIKVPEIVLRKSVTHSRVFDHPDRDLRGRTITSAFLIELTGGDGELPRVKGSDDAKKAKWFTLAEVAAMGPYMYGDHAHIIATMLAGAKK